jgi:wobble nucleotide-excising tRNase
MITKCKRLKNIGKFYDFSAKANALDWHKNTFVFAPNAYGKSTLVNVLRSLCYNDPKLIRARKTLGAVASPEAVIVIDGANHCFNGTRWDRPFPSIQIFDAPFIHANILAHEIGHEHKKNIHKIIIGAKGITLADELAVLKGKEKAKSQEVTDLVGHFNRGGFTLSLDAFLGIPPAEEVAVGQRIEKLEQDIKSKESEAIVQGLGFPRQATSPSFDLTTAKALAGKRLAAIHEAAEKQVLAHIARNFKDKTQARQFIRQGLDLMQVDCPFCGQDFKNAAYLFKAYREFFDEAFRAYQQGVAQQVASLARWNLDNDLTELVSTHNANLTTLSQWAPYLGVIGWTDAAATVEKCRARLAELKDKVQSELEKKQKNPNADADLSQFNALTDELGELKIAVEAYNTAVAAFTEKAKQYVANLPKSDVASIRAALAKEQQIKTRFAPEWKKWVTDYPPAKKDADDLLNQKNAQQKELKDYSKTIFDTHQKRINDLLTTLGTDFTVTGLTGKTDERANESYSDFGFLILQQTVPLTTRQDDAPCFKNTLSEGDKSALAFAFFIAALEKTLELDKQIVVFDDPLSSLDETRREATARLLLALSPSVNQLNVFTHKKDFLYMLCDKMSDNKVLQVRSDKKNGSWLEPLDVEDDRKGDHVHMVEDMERYLTEDFGPTPETMQGDIRKVFEVVLKTKYYRTLAADIKGKKGLAKLLETLFGAGLLDVDLKPKLFDLCNVTNGPHHGEIVDAPSRKLSRDELIPLIKDALNLLEKV